MLAQAMVLAPEHLKTLRLLGRTQNLRGDWAEASRNFETVRAMVPGDIDNLVDLGRAQGANGQHSNAGATLHLAVQLRNDAGTMIELGNALDAGGNAQAALDVADRVIAMEPNLVRAWCCVLQTFRSLGE